MHTHLGPTALPAAAAAAARLCHTASRHTTATTKAPIYVQECALLVECDLFAALKALDDFCDMDCGALHTNRVDKYQIKFCGLNGCLALLTQEE